MAVRITGIVEGEVQVDRALTRLSAQTRDLVRPFTEIGMLFRDIEKEQFDAEGYGWQDLSPRYRAWKEKNYPGKTKLRRTDRLYFAMTRVGDPENVNDVKPMEATFGARGVGGQRGHWHQIGAGSLPQRKVIDLRERDKRAMTKTMHVFMIRAGREAGFTVLA